ncbi:MAG: MFS transporter [Sphingomonas sp.]|nr:MAG: MFS transporter [Sphingomonas sp.]
MRLRTIVALALTYALLGLLMNSVGVVILQSIRHFDVTKVTASTLEACKDLSVVAASFLLATRVAAFGYRRALIGVLAVMAVVCFAASFSTGFVAMQALFVAIGLGFGVAKVATYSTIGLLAKDQADHASLTGSIEGVFMLGVLGGAWLFGWFIAQDGSSTDWLGVYRLIAGLCLAAALLWFTVKLDESAAEPDEARAGWGEMLKLAMLPSTIAILIGLFLYVLIEQGLGTWLPTFNSEVLHLPASTSVQMASIYVAALALGRLVSGVVLRRIDWLPVLLACLAAVAVLVVAMLPLARGVEPASEPGWRNAPLLAFTFPLIGFFLAPIYPTICSVALSAMPKRQHPTLVGLIVIFSALGGTIGSMITGFLFQTLPGEHAFYFVLLPAALIALLLVKIRRNQSLTKQHA